MWGKLVSPDQTHLCGFGMPLNGCGWRSYAFRTKGDFECKASLLPRPPKLMELVAGWQVRDRI
jgi:hypothetical protein